MKTLLFVFLLLPLSLLAQDPLQGDGKIRLYNYHLDEFAEVKFREGGKVLPEALEKIYRLLRSRDNSSTTVVEVKLLDLIDSLQDRFGADTIEIISGYRTKEFNETLLKGGHKVSPVSLHTQGKALDIHIDEIREETLRDHLISLSFGGVGYYGPLDFVHVDTGPPRRWQEPMGTRKRIGVLDPKSPAQLTSDRNDYLPGENPRLAWSFEGGTSLNQIDDLQLERFRRGKWYPCRALLHHDKGFSLRADSIQCERPEPLGLYGKYRLTFHLKGLEPLLSSNEFYLKKE